MTWYTIKLSLRLKIKNLNLTESSLCLCTWRSHQRSRASLKWRRRRRVVVRAFNLKLISHVRRCFQIRSLCKVQIRSVLRVKIRSVKRIQIRMPIKRLSRKRIWIRSTRFKSPRKLRRSWLSTKTRGRLHLKLTSIVYSVHSSLSVSVCNTRSHVSQRWKN